MRALVLSCGPSLSAFDGNTAGYDVVIGVNDVVSRFPVDWWVFGDDSTITRNIDSLASDVRKLFVKRFPVREGFDAQCGVRECEFVEARHWRKWNETEEWPSSLFRFSGPMALILAAELGATEIYVHGVDMDTDGGIGPNAHRDATRWEVERGLWGYVVRTLVDRGILVHWPASSVALYPRVVTFMAGRYYEDVCYPRLVTSLQRFGIPLEAYVVESKGSWWHNVSWKPRFILERLLERPREPVIWVDVDSEVLREPVLWRSRLADVMVHECPESMRNAGRYNSAVLYFRNTEAVRRFVARWICATELRPSPWPDQAGLEYALEDPGVQVGFWPPEYCAVDGFLGCLGVKDPVVYQHQASRVVRSA